MVDYYIIQLLQKQGIYFFFFFGKNRVFTYFSSSAFYVSKTTSQLK